MHRRRVPASFGPGASPVRPCNTCANSERSELEGDEAVQLPPEMPRLLGLKPLAVPAEVQRPQLFASLAEEIAFMGKST